MAELDIRWTGFGAFSVGPYRFTVHESLEGRELDLFHEQGGSSSHSVSLGELRNLAELEAAAVRHARSLAAGGDCYGPDR